MEGVIQPYYFSKMVSQFFKIVYLDNLFSSLVWKAFLYYIQTETTWSLFLGSATFTVLSACPRAKLFTCYGFYV